uniref:Uncharacterized protein n=1 Tax=Parascaris univalens TaxID=6257 RepID=A0A915BPT2_PARUN
MRIQKVIRERSLTTALVVKRRGRIQVRKRSRCLVQLICVSPTFMVASDWSILVAFPRSVGVFEGFISMLFVYLFDIALLGPQLCRTVSFDTLILI